MKILSKAITLNLVTQFSLSLRVYMYSIVYCLLCWPRIARATFVLACNRVASFVHSVLALFVTCIVCTCMYVQRRWHSLCTSTKMFHLDLLSIEHSRTKRRRHSKNNMLGNIENNAESTEVIWLSRKKTHKYWTTKQQVYNGVKLANVGTYGCTRAAFLSINITDGRVYQMIVIHYSLQTM